MYIKTRVYVCTQCKKEYETLRTNVVNHKANYCSAECRVEAKRLRIADRITVFCETCRRVIGRFAPGSDRLNEKMCQSCKRRKTEPATCAFCESVYERTTGNGIYCGTTCRDRANKASYVVNVSTCGKCGKTGEVHHWRTEIDMPYCEKCANTDNAIRNKTHAKTMAILQGTEKIRCATCKHGKPNDASYSGWECRTNAIVCKPVHHGVLYEQR